MLTITLFLLLFGQSPHKPGDSYVLMNREGDLSIAAGTTEANFREVYEAVRRHNFEAIGEAHQEGRVILVENFTSERAQLANLLAIVPGDPVIAKVKVLTGQERGKVVYLRDTHLKTALEAAIIVGELEKELKAAKETEEKLAKIDPAEITKAIKAARIAASRADLSSRKRVFARERARKLTEVAVRHKIAYGGLDEFVRAKGLDKTP